MSTITFRDLVALPPLSLNDYDTTAWDGGHQQDWTPSGSRAARTQERAFDGVIPVRVQQVEYPRFVGYVDAAEIARSMSTQPRPMPLNLRPRQVSVVSRCIRWMQGRGK